MGFNIDGALAPGCLGSGQSKIVRCQTKVVAHRAALVTSAGGELFQGRGHTVEAIHFLNHDPMNNSISSHSSIGSGTSIQGGTEFLKDAQCRTLTEERVRDYESAQEEKRNKTVELPTVVPEGEPVGRCNTAPVHRLPLVDVDEKGRDETRFPGEENRQVVVIFNGFGGSLLKLDPEQLAKLIADRKKIEAFEKKLNGRPLELKVPIKQNGCDESGTHLMNDIKKSREMVWDTPENKHPAVQPEGAEKGRNTGVQHSRRSIWARLCAGVSHCCAVVTRRPRQTPIDQA